MDVFECIMKRRSVRSFIPEPLGDDVVREVLEAARWAPSAQNRQEWAFVVIRDKEVKKKIMDVVIDIELNITRTAWNRLKVGGEALETMVQAIRKSTGRDITTHNIKDQPDLDDLLKKFTVDGIINMFKADLLIAVYRKVVEELSPTLTNAYDMGAAIENMLLVATSRGLGSVWAGGFARKEIKVEHRAVGAAVRTFYRDKISEILNAPPEMELCALVFIGKAAVEPPPPPRKPLEQIAFLDTWGNAWKYSPPSL